MRAGGVIVWAGKIGGRGNRNCLTSYLTSHATPQQYLYPKFGRLLLQPLLYSSLGGQHLSCGSFQWPHKYSITSTLGWSQDMLLCCSDSYSAFLLPQGGNPESFPWPTSMASGLQLPLRSPPLALFSCFFLLHDAGIHQLIFSIGLCVAYPTAWNAFSPKSYDSLFAPLPLLRTWLQYHLPIHPSLYPSIPLYFKALWK